MFEHGTELAAKPRHEHMGVGEWHPPAGPGNARSTVRGIRFSRRPPLCYISAFYRQVEVVPHGYLVSTWPYIVALGADPSYQVTTPSRRAVNLNGGAEPLGLSSKPWDWFGTTGKRILL